MRRRCSPHPNADPNQPKPKALLAPSQCLGGRREVVAVILGLERGDQLGLQLAQLRGQRRDVSHTRQTLIRRRAVCRPRVCGAARAFFRLGEIGRGRSANNRL